MNPHHLLSDADFLLIKMETNLQKQEHSWVQSLQGQFKYYVIKGLVGWGKLNDYVII